MGHAPQWWHDAVGYEVYVRSFADSTGDGVGDLPGITSRLDYLAHLGVDIVWVTPFYRSPMADHGYDVSDYTDVDPTFGTVFDVAALVARAHSLGMKVVVDLVPNHCSNQHRWFLDAVRSPDSEYRDHFIWRDPAPDGGPPNNWVSYFGGPAWTLDAASGQYYCHLFLPEQPDLNWASEAVRRDFDDILRTWLDVGVDGFRIDVAHALAKDPELRDNPQLQPIPDGATASEAFLCFDHQHDMGQAATLDIYRRWRSIADEYNAALIGEVYLLEADLVHPFIERGDGLDLSFWFAPMKIEWSGPAISGVLSEATDTCTTGWAWVQGSHDEVRSVTRFGGGARGAERARSLSMLLLAMPGSPFLYQGEELGLAEGVVPPELRTDPRAVRNEGEEATRDGCRTPMPWGPGHQFGFTTAPTAWLPDGGRSDADTVAVQSEQTDSPLAWYRALLTSRRRLAAVRLGDVEWFDLASGPTHGDVAGCRVGDLVVFVNAGETSHTVRCPEGRWEVAVHSGLSGTVAVGEDDRPSITLAPDQGIWLVPQAGRSV